MNTVGVKDFTMIDLIKPESKRLRRHISAVINFAKFREERLVHGVELTQEVDTLAAKKQQAEDENERLVNELRAATAVRDQEAPEESRLKEENEGLATTVQEAFNQQTAVHEDSLRLKQELEQVEAPVRVGVRLGVRVRSSSRSRPHFHCGTSSSRHAPSSCYTPSSCHTPSSRQASQPVSLSCQASPHILSLVPSLTLPSP